MRIRIGDVARAALYLGLHLTGAWIAVAHADGAESVVLIWPPAGVAFAMLLIQGLRWWPLIAIGVLVMHLVLHPVSPLFGAYSIVSNIVATVAAAAVVRRFHPGAQVHLSVRAGIGLLYGSLVLAVVSALIGVTGMVHAGMIAPAAFGAAAGSWVMSDLFGTIVVTPTMLLAARWRNEGRTTLFEYPGLREKAVWALLFALTLVGMPLLVRWSEAYALGLASLPLALALWAAVRFEPLYAGLATLVLGLFVATVAGLGFGGFTPPDSPMQRAILIAFMCVIAIVPQMVAAAIHESRVASHRLLRRASVDRLTGLASRNAFDEQARGLIGAAGAEPMALAYLDLDQFKVVNDTVSHARGDELIREIAGVLRLAIEPGDLLARTGGDEFAVLMRRAEAGPADLRARRLRDAVAQLRFAAGDHVLAPTVSIGVVPFVAGQVRFDDLLADADTACFTAKELGGNRVQVVSAQETAVSERSTAMRWIPRLTDAIENARFRLHCQTIAPLHAAAAAAGRHFEILIRMQDPATRELLPPGAFVAAAERFGLAVRLDRHVLDRVLGWLDAHPGALVTVGSCSINLSAATLVDDDFAGYVEQRLAASRVPPQRLCFEITETSAVRDLARAQAFIRRVRALGCRFALDDFGAGFCSFAYLNALDVDYYKIDGAFVREAPASPLAHAVVRAIIDIARATGRRTIAECVESETIRAALHALDVNYVQGWAIDRPTPIETYFATAPAPA